MLTFAGRTIHTPLQQAFHQSSSKWLCACARLCSAICCPVGPALRAHGTGTRTTNVADFCCRVWPTCWCQQRRRAERSPPDCQSCLPGCGAPGEPDFEAYQRHTSFIRLHQRASLSCKAFLLLMCNNTNMCRHTMLSRRAHYRPDRSARNSTAGMMSHVGVIIVMGCPCHCCVLMLMSITDWARSYRTTGQLKSHVEDF